MSRAKIMIVDDSPLILEAVGETLREAGYEVITRSVAIGTGAAILRERPGLVLMDVSMPLLTGTEISESLNASSASHASIIVLFSDRPASELDVLAQQCGAAGFIPKSAQTSSLLADVARFLTRRGSKPRSERRQGRLDEVLVAGRPDTHEWARELLRAHATVRPTDSGTEALRIMRGTDAPQSVLLGTGLLDLPAHTTWSHATRNDARWRDRIVVVEESGHPGRPPLPGMRKWTRSDPDSALLSLLGFEDSR